MSATAARADEPSREPEETPKLTEEEILSSLHVCSELTRDDNLVLSGNKTEDGHLGYVYLWAGEPRLDKSPNARTMKKDLANCMRQDSLDAAVALANIAELVAPYAWDNGRENASQEPRIIEYPDETRGLDPVVPSAAYPAEDLKGMGPGSPGWDVLVGETSSFVDRYGLLHMPSGEGPFDDCGWLKHDTLRFWGESNHETFEDFKAFFEGRVIDRINRERLRMAGQEGRAQADLSELDEEAAKALLVEAFRYEPGLRIDSLDALRANEPNLYAAELSPFVKKYNGGESFDELRAKERERLCRLDDEIGDLQKRYRRMSASESEDKRESREREIKDKYDEWEAVRVLDSGDLAKAAIQAKKILGDKAENLSVNGVWRVDPGTYYYNALLVHDAIEMMAAIDGDDRAFRRILPKFHLEMFLPRHRLDRASFGRLTLWFESVGHDSYNPNPYDARYIYSADGEVGELDLARRNAGNGWQSFGGTDWLYYRLCERGEGYSDFENLVRKHLPFFLEQLIRDGTSRNYKGRFAPAFPVARGSLEYRVNDRGHDLMATIWSSLELVRRGEAKLDLSRCEVCGRLIRRKRSQGDGNVKKTCDDRCRQRKSRGDFDLEALRLQADYAAYMESGEEVRVGVDDLWEAETDNVSSGPVEIREHPRLVDTIARWFVAWLGA